MEFLLAFLFSLSENQVFVVVFGLLFLIGEERMVNCYLESRNRLVNSIYYLRRG